MPPIRLALCQLNTVVGDISGNVERVLEGMAHTAEAGADVVVFPELTITGYPPEDLLLKPKFVADNLDGLNRLAEASKQCAAVVGYVDRTNDIYNAAAILQRGEIVGRYYKQILPNYGPFDEQRYFKSSEPPTSIYSIAGVRVGITICEDAWFANGPVAQQAEGGADLLININASPFFAGRLKDRKDMLKERALESGVPIVYVNQVGGQDELVFDGGSLVVGADGEVVAAAVQFAEEVLIVDLDVSPTSNSGLKVVPLAARLRSVSSTGNDEASIALKAEPLTELEEIWSALVVGTRDYVEKNGFSDVVVALSGGVDSSIVAAIAVDAIGASRVHGVLMPSRYSSASSITDAEALAVNLGIETRTIPIEPAHASFLEMMTEGIDGDVEGLTEENLQSRIRGVTLMALSNQFNWLVLTTGNKSELAVGYSTLYGDTAGGFAVIKDVAKTQAYDLCDWRNTVSDVEVIPTNVLTKAPSAELRPNQKDQDSLPPYDVLDPILAAYVENDMTASEIEERGFDPAVVRRIVRLVDLAEYKRRQSPLGVRVTAKAFGKDRRVPITNRYPG